MEHCAGASSERAQRHASRRRRYAAFAAVALIGSGASWPAAADAERIETIVSTVCQGCHMLDGNSVVPTYPKLAGLHRDYLAKQLEDILDGRRRNDVMAPVLSQFKRTDIPGLAAYYERQTPTPGVVQNPALLDAGRRLYEDGNDETGVPSCAGCHQDDASGNDRFPRLAGQHQAYVVQEMRRFRTHERVNGKYMGAVSERLTDAEIAAVAEYLASLP